MQFGSAVVTSKCRPLKPQSEQKDFKKDQLSLLTDWCCWMLELSQGWILSSWGALVCKACLACGIKRKLLARFC